jgi:hypothetical protein
MAYDIVFLGLINFFELEGEKGRLLLVPDGRKGTKPEFDPNDDIDEHHASFLVEKRFINDKETKWKGDHDFEVTIGEETVVLREFPIAEPSFISITGMEKARDRRKEDKSEFEDEHFEKNSIKLKDAIEIDPKEARTIARMEIRQGTLVSARLKSTLAAVLSVTEQNGDVVIETSTGDRLTLADGAEFVLVNWSGKLNESANIPENATAEEKEDIKKNKNHFRLYAQLGKKKDPSKFKEPEELKAEIDEMEDVAEIDSKHPFVEMIRNDKGGEVPETQCSVTGCCDAWMCAKRWEGETA